MSIFPRFVSSLRSFVNLTRLGFALRFLRTDSSFFFLSLSLAFSPLIDCFCSYRRRPTAVEDLEETGSSSSRTSRRR